MSNIFNSAGISETMNNSVANVTGADNIITENYSNVVQHGIKIDMSVSEKTISGAPPLTFNSNGTPLIDYIIYGNSVQDGTPTPESPIDVSGVGNAISGNYVIPITTNSTTTINLNSVPTTRRIKKLLLDGTESWKIDTTNNKFFYVSRLIDNVRQINGFCSHFSYFVVTTSNTGNGIFVTANGAVRLRYSECNTVDDFKSFLAQQYSAGTPVCVWYVLLETETGIVNEPLMKIGNYADSISYSQSEVTIPTANGNNTIGVQTTPKPSNIVITYKGR